MIKLKISLLTVMTDQINVLKFKYAMSRKYLSTGNKSNFRQSKDNAIPNVHFHSSKTF